MTDRVYEVTLDGGGPWGFRLQGGKDFGTPLKIARITPGSKAAVKQVNPNDVILEINNSPIEGLTHMEAQNVIKNSGGTLRLKLKSCIKVLEQTEVIHSANIDHKFNSKPRAFPSSSPASAPAQSYRPSPPPSQAPRAVVSAPKFSPAEYAQKKKEELENRKNQTNPALEDSDVLRMLKESNLSDEQKARKQSGSFQKLEKNVDEGNGGASQTFRMVHDGRHPQHEVAMESSVLEHLKETAKLENSGLSSEGTVPSRVFQRLRKSLDHGQNFVVKPDNEPEQSEQDLPPPPPELMGESETDYVRPSFGNGQGGNQSKTFQKLQSAVATGDAEAHPSVFNRPAQPVKSSPSPSKYGPKGQTPTAVQPIPKAPMPSGPTFRVNAPKSPSSPVGGGSAFQSPPPNNQPPRSPVGSSPSSAVQGTAQKINVRQSPQPVPGKPDTKTPLCSKCDEVIRGPFVSAIGKTWHPEHFACASCATSLQNQGFVEEQGMLYCERCYNEFFAPKCATCGKSVVGNCVNAIGKAFHPEHFVCASCGKSFGNQGFLVDSGNPYCESCYDESFGVKCAGCGRSISGGEKYVEAMDSNFHSGCFKCDVCHVRLEGSSFFCSGGRTYCAAHKNGR